MFKRNAKSVRLSESSSYRGLELSGINCTMKFNTPKVPIFVLMSHPPCSLKRLIYFRDVMI